MAFQVSGKNIAIGESLAQRARNRVQAMVDRHSEGAYTGHLTLTREGAGFRADCALNLNSGLHVIAEANSHDAYDCVDAAIERLGKQLTRQAAKAKEHVGPPPPAEEDAAPVKARSA